MRPVRSIEGRETAIPAGETDRRAAAIAAMGYRLAAAGPRTRQRLLDRDAVPADKAAALPMAPAAAESVEDRLPALSAWDDAAWERRISGEPEPALAQLSVARTGFPVWRMAALLASAACGFSLVLWGQGLQLDGKLRHGAARDTKPVVVASAARAGAAAPVGAQAAPPVPPARPIESLSPLPALDKPVTQAAGPAAPAAVPPPAGEPSPMAAAPGGASPASAERPPRRAAPQTSARQMAHARHTAATRMAEADPRPAPPRPHGTTRIAAAHFALPHWLTDDRPAHAAPLIMSPPPHDLEPPATAEVADARQAPPRPAQGTLPPIPLPGRRPPLIYAQAHYPPPPASGWTPHPYYNAAPYFGGTSQTYGYYGAMPPPTPYGEP